MARLERQAKLWFVLASPLSRDAVGNLGSSTGIEIVFLQDKKIPVLQRDNFVQLFRHPPLDPILSPISWVCQKTFPKKYYVGKNVRIVVIVPVESER